MVRRCHSVDSLLTAEELVDLQVPSAIQLSPNGRRIIYRTKALGRKERYEQASLWIADTDTAYSARQLTNGNYNDRMPLWSTNDASIAFISDREGHGRKCGIYIMSLNDQKPVCITPSDYEAEIPNMLWSPDGKYIAYLSADEGPRPDIKVNDEWKKFDRLRIMDMTTRESSTLFDAHRHVTNLAWSQDSNDIIFLSKSSTGDDTGFVDGTRFHEVSVSDRIVKDLIHFPGNIDMDPVYIDNIIYFKAGMTPNLNCTALVLYEYNLEKQEYKVVAFGKEDTLYRIKTRSGTTSVVFQSNLHDKIAIIEDKIILYSVEQAIVAHDVVKNDDNIYKIAFVTSTVSVPAEVYFKLSDSDIVLQLSDHGRYIRHKVRAKYSSIQCRSYDDKFDLNAIWVSPREADTCPPSPTVVFVHGGPVQRVTNQFDKIENYCLPWIMSQGLYGVLAVNYRSGTERRRVLKVMSSDTWEIRL